MQHWPRSYLFVPGDRPERFGKAAASGAHRIVLDLEDAVPPGHKDAAREAVAAWLASHPGTQALVRVNADGTPWHADDLSLLARFPHAGCLLAKSEPQSLARTAMKLAGDRELVGLVESVAGLMGLRQMAATPGVSRFAFGSIDFGLDAGMADGDEEPGMTALRVMIALESRFAGLAPPIDGVTTNLTDPLAASRQAERAKRLGFGGKLCIHPAQVAGVNEVFGATQEELEWAAKVIAAFEAAGGTAVAHDGFMIDQPVVERARRLLDSR